eukprot:CAMPEP_0169167860 /NCGR_PEP_ID=MMETSP1015-20121227/60696_1 /TAXON_ID=342587 /ORGANISM="Karlodinium micrum, Strain CCMP2283" /LENGTH=578 /DNA_ID=CAMNT_0009240597 /DNA_START=186 /DNA_END=1923 /DNA_ORIENTATION=+
MAQNCCMSCRTCESVWDIDAGGYTCGARIQYLEKIEGLSRVQAKARIGAEFPTQCGACNGAASSCTGDKNDNCQYWASQGYCTRSADYMNENCCQSCEGNTGGGGGDHCKPLSVSQPKDRALNVVLVPSAFNGDMSLWGQKARYVTDIFKQYKPFDADNIPQLNVWYVDVDMPSDDGRQCHFGCHNIDRLLCCNGKHNFIAHAKSHCGDGFIMNTLIIHNSDTYGGAGFTSDGAASCSTNSLAPQIAIHELGHSLFGLADEYSVGCVPGKCAGGAYYAAENSVMDAFSYKFGEANERITCCKYLYHFGEVPGYCAKFSQGGLNLQQFCATGLWRGEYTTLGALDTVLAASTVNEQLSNTSAVVLANVVPTTYLEHAATDPQGQGFIYVAAPREWTLGRFPYSAYWVCIPTGRTKNAGLYPTDSVTGDSMGGAPRGNVSIYVRSASGELVRQLMFLTEEPIEIPLPANASNLSNISGTNATNVSEVLVPRDYILVILDASETCHIDASPPTTAAPKTTVTTTAMATTTATTTTTTTAVASTTTIWENPLPRAIGMAVRIFNPSLWTLAGCGLVLPLIIF